MSNYKAYFLKSMGLNEDSLSGGKGDNTSNSQVDPEQLQMGIKVEMEHTQDESLAREIAMDHLTEDPQYYTHLKDAGMADELPGSNNGETKPMFPQMSKLFSPTAIMPTPVIATAVRGTKYGDLPAGGFVADPEKSRLGGWEEMKVLPQGGVKGDPEKARLGGWERVKNLKPNSQGAISDTPASDQIKAKGGHFTPDNGEITRGEAPKTNREGSDAIHPMQVQQLGNEPIDDDGTTRNGKETPAAANAGVEGGCAPESQSTEHPLSKFVTGNQDGQDEPDQPGDNFEKSDSEDEKGPWGIGMDDEAGGEEEEEEREDGITIDIKEILRETEATSPPAEGVAGWPDLVELTNGAQFQTLAGPMDMWALLGFEGLTMRDAESQTPKFFDFIIRHKNETQRFYSQQGEKIQFADIGTLKQGWQQSRKDSSAFEKSLKNQPRACKVCGDTFTPSKGEGICSKCGTKTNECNDCGCGDPTNDHEMKSRFQKLANIKTEAGLTSEDKVKQLKELVGRLNSKGKVTPLLAKAQKYLDEYDNSDDENEPEYEDYVEKMKKSKKTPMAYSELDPTDKIKFKTPSGGKISEMDSPEEAKEGKLQAFIQNAVSNRNPTDDQNKVAEAIVIKLEDMGVKNIQQRYDYILSLVTKYWK